MPDLGQVPQHHSRIMPPGLMPVITPLRRQRPDLGQQVPLSGIPVENRQVPYPPDGPG
jgi:hypothetical protein